MCPCRWVSENIRYDFKALRTKNFGPMDPESVLKSRSSVCDGYARLLVGMLTQAKMRAYKVCGCGKGQNWDDNGESPTKSNHAWVAVQIQCLVSDPGVIEPSNAPPQVAARPITGSQSTGRGPASWCLIDPCWMAGDHERTKGGQVVCEREFNDEYFLTRPEYFILDHLPTEQAWQLLPPANIMHPENCLIAQGSVVSGWRATSHPLNNITLTAAEFKKSGLSIRFELCKPLESSGQSLKFRMLEAFGGLGGFYSVGKVLASVEGTGGSEGGAASSFFSLTVSHVGVPTTAMEFRVSCSSAAEVAPGSVIHLEAELGVTKGVRDLSRTYTPSEATYTLRIT